MNIDVWDNDISLLDEWAKVARLRNKPKIHEGLTMCADFFAGLSYCRTEEQLAKIANALSALKMNDARVREIRERFRVERIKVLSDIREKSY